MKATQVKDRVYRQTALESANAEGDSRASIRSQAFERLRQIGFPTRKWESWKYINLAPVLDRPYEEPASDASSNVRETLAALPFGSAASRIVSVNGTLRGDLSSSPSGGGLKYGSLGAGHKNGVSTSFGAAGEFNPFVLLNTAHFRDEIDLNVPKDTSVKEPVHVFLLTEGRRPFVSYPRLKIRAEDNSRSAVVVHQHSAVEAGAFTDAVIEIELGRNAQVEMVLLEQNGAGNHVFSSVRAKLAEGSRLEYVCVTRGGDLVKNDFLAELEGPDASISANGLGILSGDTGAYSDLLINHRAPSCVSRQFYKNILGGRSRSEFNSLSHVYPGAQKSDSQQLNKNLLLSREAKAYARPSLKIYADDVKAGHGSATGKTEERELFYLRSRGLDMKTARFIITMGFAEEILMKIKDAEVRRSTGDFVRAALGEMMGENT